ncbi:ATP-binding cassette domain-containing protein [Cellulomonas rhizosphaerae]|uniref:ATP-binding cassette domain-containing protein n=1 Tax=Cellulomonas rhizosphaerae TaxID=2293719 RepID=A0A413RHB6_9CELL|nr:ATP-binding cassette domain-containing protein [Cellulomonas rhizosphaerae]RHA37531.1 ATP-binding cassette domain-containing protein [Cellulomonas rhizosphaerae]
MPDADDSRPDEPGTPEAGESAPDPAESGPQEPDVDEDESADEPEPEPAPAIEAHALGLHLRTGWVFRHVTLTAHPGDAIEVVGSGGTGRSMLLLALVGRARHSTGDLSVLGRPVPTGRTGAAQARAVRRRTAVAQVGPPIELEGQQRVREAAAERRRWDHVHRREDVQTLGYDEAAALVGLAVDPHELVDELAAVDRTLLAVALALAAPHEVLVVDDVDRGLSEAEHRRLGDALADVAATGVVVISAATRPSGAELARVLDMPIHDAVHAAAQVRETR